MIFRKGKWKGLGPLSAGFALTLEASGDADELAAVVGIHLRRVLEQADPASFKDPAEAAFLAVLLSEPDHDLDVHQLAGLGRAHQRAFVIRVLDDVWSLQDNIGARDEALFVQMVAAELVSVLKCEAEWEVRRRA